MDLFVYKYNRVLALLIVTVTAIFPNIAFSHGGVTMDQDVCIMKLDRLTAHFAGYQPEYRATQEFCEDIPVVGKSIFVIDFISDGLREMLFDFRIIKDVNEIGNYAKLEDLGGPQAIEDATLYYKDYALYPRGTVTAEFNFTEEGRYIGIVTAKYDEDSQVITSVFPFQVGLFNFWKFLIPMIIIVILSSIGFGIFLGIAKRQNNK